MKSLSPLERPYRGVFFVLSSFAWRCFLSPDVTWASGEGSTLRIHASTGTLHHAAQKSKDWNDGTFVVLSMTDVNMTCQLYHGPNTFDGKSTRAKYIFSWTVPSSLRRLSNGRISNHTTPGENLMILALKNVTKEDSGLYKCEANSVDESNLESLTETVRLFVVRNPNVCKENWFRCKGKKSCIHPRYICDGQEDCDDPSDESMDLCGENPCKEKLYCKTEGRCLAPDLCCPGRPLNSCTPDICCDRLNRYEEYAVALEDGPRSFRKAGDHNVDYLQTSVFIVMGCALAFVFITIALITSIYRFRLMRAVMVRTARHYSNNATRSLLTGMPTTGTSHRNAASRHLDVVSWLHNGGNFLITYNINNGVQILGNARGSMPPPSYNEAVRGSNSAPGSGASRPPTSSSLSVLDSVGPPPPYASRESLVAPHGVASASSPLLGGDQDPLRGEDVPEEGDINGNSVESVEENNNHVMDRNHSVQ